MDNISSIKLIKGPEGLDISFNGRLLKCTDEESKRRLNSVPIKANTLYIVFSPLLFSGIENLENRIPKNSRILFIEQEEKLYQLGLPYFNSLNLKNSQFFLVSNIKFDNLIKQYTNLKIRRTELVRPNRGYLINREKYETFYKKSEEYIQQFWKNKITTIYMGRLWFRNIFQNLLHLISAQPIECLKTSKPIVVCGAGESLEQSINFLKKNRNYFFLVSVDTAVSTLLNNKLRPDLVIILEAQHANLFDFYLKDAFTLPAAFDLTSSPEVVRKFTGTKYFFISDFIKTSLFEKLNDFNILPTKIPPLGSVGIVAIYLSKKITNSYVFFTGIDFSFLPDKYHAKESPTHRIMLFKTNRILSNGFFSTAWNGNKSRIKDKAGRYVYTDLVMTSYANILKGLIKKDYKVFTISKFGIINNKKMQEDTAETFLLAESNAKLGKQSTISEKCFSKKMIFSFLENELLALKETTAMVVAYRNKKNNINDEKIEIEKNLTMIDYPWLFFPDIGDVPEESPSFLKRFLFSAAWFEKIISNTIESIL